MLSLKSPATAGVPANSFPAAPAKQRGWRIGGRKTSPWLGPAIVAAVLGAILLAAATVVPVPQSIQDSFTIAYGSGVGYGWGPNLTPQHSGVFDFSWSTNNDVPVSFAIVVAVGLYPYSVVAANGSGSINVYTGQTYEFSVRGAGPETVQFTSHLHFGAPLL